MSMAERRGGIGQKAAAGGGHVPPPMPTKAASGCSFRSAGMTAAPRASPLCSAAVRKNVGPGVMISYYTDKAIRQAYRFAASRRWAGTGGLGNLRGREIINANRRENNAFIGIGKGNSSAMLRRWARIDGGDILKGMLHQSHDAVSLEIARRIARGLPVHPKWIDLARENLTRWSQRNRDAPGLLACYEEWRELLEHPVEEISAALVAESDKGQRLRQNSPFAGR